MRSRFGLSGSRVAGSDLMSSAIRQGEEKFRKERYRHTRRLDHRTGNDEQRLAGFTGADEFNTLKDSQIAGIMELGVLKDGTLDKQANGNVVIGGREFPMSEGKVRFINKAALDEAVGPMMEEKRYKDAILSAVLTDRTGRLLRMVLPEDRYKALDPQNSADYLKWVPNAPPEIVQANGKVEFWSLHHSSSSAFALGLHKLSLLMDRTPIAFDQDVLDYLSKFSNGGGAVVASEPRV